MFTELFRFEMMRGLKRPSTYIFFALYFGLALLIGLAAAGKLGTTMPDTATVNNSGAAVANLLIGLNSNILGLLNSIILIAVMATTIQQDYQYNTHPFYFTKPIHKAHYFFARYFSGMVLATIVFSGLVWGYMLGTAFSLGTPLSGPFRLWNFIQPFLLFTLPNLMFQGAMFFALATFLRSTLPAYLVAMVLLVISIATGAMQVDLDNKFWVALLEPSGMRAFFSLTEYWSPEEKNTLMVPLREVLLYNRMLWLGVAVAIVALSYWRFSFSQFLQPLKGFKRAAKAEAAPAYEAQSLAHLPKVSRAFGQKEGWKQFAYLTTFEWRNTVRTQFFFIMALLGVGMIIALAIFKGYTYDTPTYPLSYQMAEALDGMHLFIVIFVIFFGGTLMWREREVKADELVGTAPVSNTALFFSKYAALVLAVVVLLLLAVLTGIGIQIAKGFFNISLLPYLDFVASNTLEYIPIVGTVLAMQALVSNKYLGFFLGMIPVLLLSIAFAILQWDGPLYNFNSSGPSLPFSDMNGHARNWASVPVFKGYWLTIAMIFGCIGIMVFGRGKEKNIRARYRLSHRDEGRKLWIGVALSALVALFTGGVIYYNTYVAKVHRTAKEQERMTVAYEKKFKPYEHLPQPRIIASNIAVDIFPKTQRLNIKGTYVLQNKMPVPVDTVFVSFYNQERGCEYTYQQLQLNAPTTTVMNDTANGVLLLKLQNPLQPGDSLQFHFAMKYQPTGFVNGSTVVGNGTFFNNSIFPSFGYDPNGELNSNVARKEYGLPFKPRMAKVDDSAARMNNYISRDADWVRFETTVSTDAPQTAIAPGYLQREWEQNGRRYFHYKMDSPILNFYAYLSAHYTLRKDQWKDVSIEIYYQQDHEYNIDRMIRAIKKSLDYYTTHFGPYQHRQVRILEFPRYAGFAQSFPNTIPYSESIGFITQVDDEDFEKIDMPFYVTAHEVAHQWWAHQVIGGHVQGSEIMSETMSQYSALMVMEKEYGRASMRKFLKHETDRYLRGRSFESKGEMPLMLVENQGYIHYNKGSVVMYALRDFLGEEVLNGALRQYLQQTKFQGPMYTNSIEFVDAIRRVTPDSLRYLIKDMFEEITLYENYVKAFEAKPIKNGQYEVKLTVGSAKWYADSSGRLLPQPLNDYMDIGVFAKATAKNQPDKELVLQRVKMSGGEKTFTFIVSEKPTSAGIDPYLKLIDRTPKNNLIKVGETPPKPELSTQNKASKVSIQL